MPPSLPSDSRFVAELTGTIAALQTARRDEEALILTELLPFAETLVRSSLPAEDAQKLVAALKLTRDLERACAAAQVNAV